MKTLALLLIAASAFGKPESPWPESFRMGPYYERSYYPNGRVQFEYEWKPIGGGRWQHTIRDGQRRIIKRFIFTPPTPK